MTHGVFSSRSLRRANPFAIRFAFGRTVFGACLAGSMAISPATAGAEGGVPTCTLSASPGQVAAGEPVRLAASCRPAATSFIWEKTGFDRTASGGTVAPTATTTYTVRGVNADGLGNLASATVLVTASGVTTGSYANDFCRSGNYPTQWQWDSTQWVQPARPATSGTPRMTQIRNGVVIATYAKLGGDAWSKPNSAEGGDPATGPFRRSPYTQWRSGDVFEIYPAVYSGSVMQIYIGPNRLNDTAKTADIPRDITIRGVTVDGRRPVIVNPPTGAANANFNQSLVYIGGAFDSSGKLVAPAANITIENIDIVDASEGGYIGKAGVYINGANNVTLRNVRIAGFKRHKANGIFATGNNSGTLLLENVELDSNGGNNGPEHNAYINASGVDPDFTFRVQGSWSHDAFYGHALKSRAQRTIVEGSYLSGSRAAPGTQTETYLLDVPDGGTLIARNNVFVKNRSGNLSNGASITFGVESASLSRKWELLLEHNTFIAFDRYYDDAMHPLFPMYISGAAPGPKTVDSNLFVGYCNGTQSHVNFRGTNAQSLNFNEIEPSFRPRLPVLSGREAIVGTPQYLHMMRSAPRRSTAVGARD